MPEPAAAPEAVSAAPSARSRETLDARFMATALALGARNLGHAAPNPSVGAVIVAETPAGPLVVGRGVTHPGGRPHAERIALDRAGEAARGATMYVTLEPCSHHGRTSPCSDAIIEAGIARVVSAIEDADPRVRGRGHARLRAAGIAVEVGLGAQEAFRQHRGHFLRVTAGRPAVHVKLAQTRDGIAARPGTRLMITGRAANNRVHLMRSHADAIMVGVGTVLADDPQLTVRLPGMEERSPLRIVVDSALRTPVTAGLVQTARDRPTWIVATEKAPVEAERALRAAGVEVMRVAAGSEGRVNLAAMLQLFGSLGLTRLLCEGGPALAEELAKADLVDEVTLITASHAYDGHEPGIAALGPALAAALAGEGSLVRFGEAVAGEDHLAFWERVG
ncbi:diaminohydroxyphosphoribosylaminopyrimidine deaminase/5-amino-6-(5-phosphoribosylamino)uracil reductase [Chelatococcus composti]|uniref:Riboflavin biosynthesis protein RibD n=2 Tax=Chelatococcus composti TaxID=1743235 RepID=A0A841KE37_9HYPH|nr:diaminohydroxyphosphoribosylaminopyrimidine deaminase/5-amino-6-(5-phosphoribosylamino)uracil reductase [Chelatococcus composti]